MVRHASCSLQRQASAACHAQERLDSLLLGRRSTRADCARSPCRSGYGRRVPFERPPRHKKASLFRRAPGVRRASCVLQRQASAACHTATQRGRAGARCHCRQPSLLRARALPRRLWPAWSLQKGTAPKQGSLFRRAPGVRRASCGLHRQPNAIYLAGRRRACARCHWGGRAALELAAYSHRAALVVIDVCTIEAYCRDERSLSFGARSCFAVPASASNAKPVRVLHVTQLGAPAAATGEKSQGSRACCARAPCRALCGRRVPSKWHCSDKRHVASATRACGATC